MLPDSACLSVIAVNTHAPMYHWRKLTEDDRTQVLKLRQVQDNTWKVGSKEAKRIWLMYPILDYGKKWDI